MDGEGIVTRCGRLLLNDALRVGDTFFLELWIVMPRETYYLLQREKREIAAKVHR